MWIQAHENKRIRNLGCFAVQTFVSMKRIGLIGICLLALNVVFGQSYPADKEKFVKAFQSLTSEYVTKEQKSSLLMN